MIPLITILIVTKDRHDHIKSCLDSLKKSSFRHFEVIVIDQSTDFQTQRILDKCNEDYYLGYFKMNRIGKTKGLNMGIKICKTTYLAFTDDDCILDGSWLSTIISTFDRYPGISGIYGCTKPYLPAFKEGCVCPCVTKNLRNQKGGVIKNFSKHWEDLGFGNNMAFRREVFEELGDFKEWLGPGSIGMNCEDGEIALRCLVSKKNLYYNPKMIVYHNRWLTKEEYQRQELSYICGEMACYGYYAFQGYSFGRNVVKENIVKTLKDFKTAIRSLFFLNKGIFYSWRWFFLRLYARFRGIFIGYIFFLKEKGIAIFNVNR